MTTYQYELKLRDGWVLDYLLAGRTLDDIWEKKKELENTKEFKKYLKNLESFSFNEIETDEVKIKIKRNKKLEDNVNSIWDQCLDKCLTDHQVWHVLLLWAEMSRIEIALHFNPDCINFKKPTSTVDSCCSVIHEKFGVHDDKALLEKLTRYITD